MPFLWCSSWIVKATSNISSNWNWWVSYRRGDRIFTFFNGLNGRLFGFNPSSNWMITPDLFFIVRSPPQKKKTVAKLHYITRHVWNGCRHILATMLSRCGRCGCNEHFNMKRFQQQDSDAVYSVSKFNFSRNLWNIEICYFGLRMLSSSFCFYFFSTRRFL